MQLKKEKKYEKTSLVCKNQREFIEAQADTERRMQRSYPKWLTQDLNSSGVNVLWLTEFCDIGAVTTHAQLDEILGFHNIFIQGYPGEKTDILAVGYVYYITYPDGFRRVKVIPKSRPILDRDGKVIKYLSPLATMAHSNHMMFDARKEALLGKANVPLFVCEGEKKAWALQHRIETDTMPAGIEKEHLFVIGVPGANMWQNQPWDAIRLSKRKVFIIFDKDTPENPDVQMSVLQFFLFLRSKKAVPEIVTWDGIAKGVDDYLMKNKDPSAVAELIANATQSPKEALSLLANGNGYEFWVKACAAAHMKKISYHAIFDEMDLATEYHLDFSTFNGLMCQEYQKMAQVEEVETKAQEIASPTRPASSDYIAKVETNDASQYYLVKKTGIWLCVSEFDKKAKKFEVSEKRICADSIVLQARMVDIFGQTAYVQLAWGNRSAIVPMAWLSKTAMTTTLPEKGLRINSANADDMAKYFLASMNQIETEVPFATRNGWLRNSFILGNKRIFADHVEDIEVSPEFNPFDVGRHGDVDVWKAEVNSWLKRLGPVASLVFGASVASVLAVDMCIEPSIFHIWGESSQGKSTMARIAASIWGQTESATSTIFKLWHGTAAGHEMYFSTMNNIACFLDDSQDASQDMVQRLVQWVVTGVSKQRATIRNSKIVSDITRSWHTLLISTGEQKLTETTNQSGISARCIELQYTSQVTIEQQEFALLSSVLKKNYGFGDEVLRFYLEHKDIVQSWHGEALKALQAHFPQIDNIRRRSLSVIALATVGMKIASKLWGLFLPTISGITGLLDTTIVAAPKPASENFYDFLVEMFHSQRGRFATINPAGEYIPSATLVKETVSSTTMQKTGEKSVAEGKDDLGIYWELQGVVGFYPMALRKLAIANKFPERSCLAILAQKGLLKVTPGFHNRFYVRIQGKGRITLYAITLPEDKAIE